MRESLIETLNDLLVGELTASNRCLAHAELCDENGYARLLEANERRAQEEMAHARALISRLIAMKARPVPKQQYPVAVESDVSQQIRTDLRALEETVTTYREAIKLASDAGDHGTREMLERILAEEEQQLRWVKSQATELEQLGLQGYLRQQQV